MSKRKNDLYWLIKMHYEVQVLAATLKSARERKGLSQRDLSALAGVPQSHISKIETSGVDLRISSLVALAHALDLDLALVPRKAIPAVQSIARSVDVTPQTLPEVARQITGLAQEIERVGELKIDPETLQRVRRAFREIQQFQNLIREPAMLRSAREAIKTVNNSEGLKALRESAQLMTILRNKLAHVDFEPQNLPRRAYQLDGDDDA